MHKSLSYLIRGLLALALIATATFVTAAEPQLKPPDELVAPAPPTTHYAKGEVLVDGVTMVVTNMGRAEAGGARLRFTAKNANQMPRVTVVPEGQHYGDIQVFLLPSAQGMATATFRYDFYIHKVHKDGSIDAIVKKSQAGYAPTFAPWPSQAPRSRGGPP